jgi:hypothetical protein
MPTRHDAVNLKNRLGNVATDRCDPLHADLLRIALTPSATTSMALTWRWRSRPQHQERTLSSVLRDHEKGLARMFSDGW